jgi:PKD repeat protein
MATSKSWWIITENSFLWFWTYWTATLYSTRTPDPLPSINLAPQASFAWTPVEAIVGEPINLESTSFDPDGNIDSIRWIFPNGTIYYEESLEIIFENPGLYTIILEVTDNDGATDQATANINVISEEPIITTTTTSDSTTTTPSFGVPENSLINLISIPSVLALILVWTKKKREKTLIKIT